MDLSKAESLPTEFKVGDRVYEILNFLKGGEKRIIGHEMVKRAVEMNAHLGEDDGQYLLDHQQDIPEAFRGKVYFVFTGWFRFNGRSLIYCVYWDGGRWIRVWNCLVRGHWDDHYRVLRRKK